jgi:hypothetical protein
MTGNDKPPAPKPTPTDYRQRARMNMFAGVGIVVLLLITWFTVKLFSDQEKLGSCIASGRKNCVDLGTPPRTGVFVPSR